MPSPWWWCWGVLCLLLLSSGPALWPWQCLWVTQHCTRPSPQRNPVNYEQTRCIWGPWWCWAQPKGGDWLWLGAASGQGERWRVAAVVEMGWGQQWRELP